MEMGMSAKQLLRFRHLKQRHIVENWPQLKRLVETQNFPPGRLLGSNSRAWTEAEIDAWLETRPVTREEAAA
jgi:predicted DNA-binding transcriptional regulator AlpA